MCPLMLSITPSYLEEAFWKEAGTPAYALADRYAYSATIVNTVALWFNMRNASQAEWLFDACPAYVTALVRAAHVGPLYVAVASLLMATLLPGRYRSVREPLVIAQRVVRAINTPAFPACTSAAAYGRRIAHEIASSTAAPEAAAGWAVVKHVSLLGVLWAMQVLLFAFRFRWAAPLQLAAAAAGAVAMRSLGCALRSQRAAADAAAKLCGLLEAAGAEALSPVSVRGGGLSATCSEAALEFWVGVVFAFSSLLPLYVIHCRERHHKLAYLRSRGYMEQRDADSDLAVFRHATAVVGAAAASVMAADLAVSLGWMFDCSY